MIHCILAIIFGVFALAADQYTKYYIETNFEIGQAKEFINGFINLIYYRNNGAAWGIFSGRTWLLILLTLFLMAISIFVFIKYSKNSKLIIWSLPFIFFGGIGNLIDRIFRNGEVIDFLHFEFYRRHLR